MAEDIESYEFRDHARRNGYRYGKHIFIYKDFSTALVKYGMPKYDLRDSVGAIESFAGLLQNVNNALENDPNTKFAKNLPGVNTPKADFNLSIDLSGPMYLKGYKDYESVYNGLDAMAHTYGWETQRMDNLSVTYRPRSLEGVEGDLYSEDPTTAASRAMMTSSLKHGMDAMKVLHGALGGGTEADYAKNIVALENDGIMQTLKAAKTAFDANTGAALAGKWANAGMPLEAVREDVVVDASVNLVPMSLTVVPHAFVLDGEKESQNRLYPTRLEISVTLANPYGKLFRTNTEVGG